MVVNMTRTRLLTVNIMYTICILLQYKYQDFIFYIYKTNECIYVCIIYFHLFGLNNFFYTGMKFKTIKQTTWLLPEY